MSSLPELQRAFAASLRGAPGAPGSGLAEGELVAAAGGVSAPQRLQIYRSNARAMFDGALERSYPVLRRRVGDDYFRQLAHGYRARHPSRSGDLHGVGSHFPAYLAATEAGTAYAWLAELAALEWACEEALVAAAMPPAGVAILAGLDADELAATRLVLQPSLACVRSAFPVLDIWRANQPDADGRAVDLARGGQCVLVSCGESGLELREVDAAVLGFVALLQRGEPLGAAVDGSGLPLAALPAALGLLFSAGLVAAASVA